MSVAPHSHREPFPGSEAARALGCRCPMLDNAYGRGYMGGIRDSETGELVFVVAQGCPLHWQEVVDP